MQIRASLVGHGVCALKVRDSLVRLLLKLLNVQDGASLVLLSQVSLTALRHLCRNLAVAWLLLRLLLDSLRGRVGKVTR